MARERFSSVLYVLGMTLALQALALADTSSPGVVCSSRDLFPLAQCQSTTEKIKLMTEWGPGEDADFENATRLIVDVKGPNDAGDLSSVSVLTQKPLLNNGLSTIVRENNSPVLVPAEVPASYLKQKDAIVIVSPSSGVSTLDVDVSASVPGHDAGRAVIVADSLEKIKITAHGYNGKSGEPVLTRLAKKALEKDESAVPGGIADSYVSRREESASLTLNFDSVDLNNYEASGLVCQSGETAVGRSGSYAFDTAGTAGPYKNSTAEDVPYEISVTAFKKEESKRAFCQRKPEVTIAQDCEAEKEYSFQALCRVLPEERSINFYKRDLVRWQRALCSPDTNTKIRRKIIRQARVFISVPGGKSYNGIVNREVTFRHTANLYRQLLNPSSPSELLPTSEGPSGNGTQASDSNDGVLWYNPFWQQLGAIDLGDEIELDTNVKVPNHYNNQSLYPPKVTSYHRQGAKLLFVPRKQIKNSGTAVPLNCPWAPTGDCFLGTEDLYGFQNQTATWQVPSGTTSYGGTGCGELIALTGGSSTHPTYGPISPTSDKGDVAPDTTGTGKQYSHDNYLKYLRYFKSFDAGAIGFTHQDLTNASVIRVTECYAYEVIEAIVEGTIVRGKWNVISGTPEQAIVDVDPNISSNLACPLVGNTQYQQIGIENLLQYEKDDVCYVDDPRHPPDFLVDAKPPGQGNQEAFALEDLFGQGGTKPGHWTRASNSAVDPLSSATGYNPSGNIFWEIDFPSSVTAQDRQTMLNQWNSSSDLKPLVESFCVHLPSPSETNPDSPSYWNQTTNPGAWPQTTRSVSVPLFHLATDSDIAVPTGQTKRVCPTGVRLDQFIANARRPSCPIGASTKLALGTWSSDYGAQSWLTWDQRGGENPPQRRSQVRSVTETRYHDLPARILTAKTNEVHPSVFVDGLNSFTGKAFPPTYGFSSATPGVSVGFSQAGATTTSPTSFSRSSPGWLRENDLRTRSGSLVTPSTFTPFYDETLSLRLTKWCNADAYVTHPESKSLVKGFGAKGILRDAPKRVLGFELVEYNHQVPGFVKERLRYVGVEVTGLGSGGFFTNRGFFQKSVLQMYATTAEDGGITAADFTSSDYPFIGARFKESCGAGEKYNEFTGLCHESGSPWLASSRVVDKIAHSNVKTPWKITLSKQSLRDDDVSRVFDYPFYIYGGGAPRAPSETLTGNSPRELVQLGFLRSTLHMTLSPSDREMFTNRPDAYQKMVLAPGFASAPSSDATCKNKTIILAVPYSSDYSSDVSIKIDRNGRLPEGAVLIAFGTDCPAGVFIPYAVIKKLGPNGELTTDNTSTPATTHLYPETADVDGIEKLALAFRDDQSNPKFVMRDITEILTAGMSATTGSEKLEGVELNPLSPRDRKTEWQLSGRNLKGDWKSRIQTELTPPSTDQNQEPYTCAVRQTDGTIATSGNVATPSGGQVKIGILDGYWKKDPITPIFNGSASADCSDAGVSCALTREELTLFTKPIVTSLARIETRGAATQWTPWTTELPRTAPKNSQYAAGADFGDWVEIDGTKLGASVPDCSMFNGPNQQDIILARTNFGTMEKIEDVSQRAGLPFDVLRVPHPLDPVKDFMVLAKDDQIRKSDSCVRWDDVTGEKCEVFHPTIAGPEVGGYIFGGEWSSIFVDRKERLSQTCREFGWTNEVSIVTGAPIGVPDLSRCKRGNSCVAGANAPTVTDQLGGQGKRAYNPDGTCYAGSDQDADGTPDQDTPGVSSYENRTANHDPRVELCTPDTCPFQMNIQSFQVEAATPVSGSPGEDGTSAGSATIFCRSCGQIDFGATPGTGGLGTNPVSSNRSKTLSCMKSNNNPLNPIVSVRHLWSQPFVGGSAGQNGRPGGSGKGLRLYKDMSQEAIWMLTQPDFWRTATSP